MRSISFNGVVCMVLFLTAAGCKVPAALNIKENRNVPSSYNLRSDTSNVASVPWKTYFGDPFLAALIDTALVRNQELIITLQEIEIARNEVLFRQAPLRPLVGARIGGGLEKVGRYTSQGAGDASTEITPGKEFPDPLGDLSASAFARWEIDIWKKLRNSKMAAISRYLASVEGKNFVLTNLIAEVANSYYELVALDNQLQIVCQTIRLQENALEIVKIQKQAARVTELAVQKFEAEVLNSKSLEYDIRQRISETENRINFLLARFPQRVPRDSSDFLQVQPIITNAGLPSQLLQNRPDIRQAENELTAAKLDVKVARAEFFPSLEISAALGLQAFNPTYLFRLPESLLYNAAADLAAPLVNRAAIKAEFNSANARQVQAMFNYERSILNAFIEVSTQLSQIQNIARKFDLKSKEVDALNRSIEIANNLFTSARADYLEVLTTQRDALSSRLELIETKRDQMNAVVNIYRDLGGGWR